MPQRLDSTSLNPQTEHKRSLGDHVFTDTAIVLNTLPTMWFQPCTTVSNHFSTYLRKVLSLPLLKCICTCTSAVRHVAAVFNPKRSNPHILVRDKKATALSSIVQCSCNTSESDSIVFLSLSTFANAGTQCGCRERGAYVHILPSTVIAHTWKSPHDTETHCPISGKCTGFLTCPSSLWPAT